MNDESTTASSGGMEKRVSGRAGRLWADLSLMQDLEDKMNSSGSIADSSKSFKRGPESYVLPDEVRFEHDYREERIKANDANQNVDCFADVAGDELAAVESFGVATQPRKRRRRHGERTTEMAVWHYERKFRYNKVDSSSLDAEPSAVVHGQRRNSNGRAFEKRARLSRLSRNSSKNGSTSSLPENNAQSQRNARLKGLVASDYHSDELFATEFPPDVDMAELGRLMAKALGERSPDTVQEAVAAVGKELSLEIFSATKTVEKSGGMMTLNGRRRRTSGGVFLYLVKQFQSGNWHPGDPIPLPSNSSTSDGNAIKMSETIESPHEKVQ